MPCFRKNGKKIKVKKVDIKSHVSIKSITITIFLVGYLIHLIQDIQFQSDMRQFHADMYQLQLELSEQQVKMSEFDSKVLESLCQLSHLLQKLLEENIKEKGGRWQWKQLIV